MRRPSLYLYILIYSESDVYRRQILTYKDILVPAMKDFKSSRLVKPFPDAITTIMTNRMPKIWVRSFVDTGTGDRITARGSAVLTTSPCSISIILKPGRALDSHQISPN